MKFNEIIDFSMRNFLDHIDEYTQQEILVNLPSIKEYFNSTLWGQANKEWLNKMFKIVGRAKILQELFNQSQKFSWWGEQLEIPEKLKYGVEIEVTRLPLDKIQYFFETNAIADIMRVLEVPLDISDSIVQNSEFEKKNQPNKWIFTKEDTTESEASSPIMQNNLFDLNQVVAICTLLKALGAKLHGGTGLHINIGAEYLECNEKAIQNLLKIWGECEELFFKMANPEGEVMRCVAWNMASPIKENIQDFFEGDGSITLNTKDDMERFLYQIQARNRMEQIVGWSNLTWRHSQYNLHYANTDEERFHIYCSYNESLEENDKEDSEVRWTSINFNHMKWNTDNPGRIELRIFNSTLEPEIIFQDLLLVGKMFEVSLKNAKDPNYKKTEFEKLFLRDVTETRKVNNLLNLLFDKPEQKTIFKNRWKSVRKKREYKRYESGRDTFIR